MSRWLIACEESGTVRDAFLRRGIDAVSCDLKPTRSPGPHFQCDVRDILHSEAWAGVRWLFDSGPSTAAVLKGFDRWQALFRAAEFFNLFLELDCKPCLENPTMHGYATALIRLTRSQIVQPYEHGHLETKKTGLHLRGLPPLRPTNNVKEAMLALPKSVTHKVHYASPSKERAQQRSVFFRGIADAMAEQWA